jgi:chromosome segregation protein
MQLTKLEIKGFKSFADKVTIHFDKGITGIVGPNGCGKSNVVDAIRWVLGEQKSRALRSEKMDNVVFNGSKKRKATQLAEASLTFNNTKNLLPTEYSTVTVTRRYYRSGDSEYELNGVTCRLKDITNLFLDTGIASNSYAIIELKMVDDILNDKDNSRRGLFEEAAGISKFRIRKKETLRKLEGTDADLDRVEDLLFEIEKNLRSLERQANQTRKYYQLKDAYKDASISLARIKVHSQKEALERIENQKNEETDRKLALNKTLQKVEADIQSAKTSLLQKEKQLAQRQKSLNQHVASLRQYESDKKIKNERLKYLKNQAENLTQQIEQDKKSHDRAAFSINGLEKDKTKQEELLTLQETATLRSKQAFESAREELEGQRKMLSTLQENLKDKRESLYAVSKDLEIKQIQVESLRNELDKTASDTSEHSESIATFADRISGIRNNHEKRLADLQKLKQKESENDLKIEELNHTIEVVKEELVQQKRKLDARQNEYNLTKSLIDNLEGFPEAIKFLKKESQWAKRAPLLSDVITCDEAYRVTIENYLEPYMNHYVVDDESHALRAVNLLSDASKGKANFFVLSSFDEFEPAQSQIFEKCIPATEIVEFDPKYRKLISYILDQVYIVSGDFALKQTHRAA